MTTILGESYSAFHLLSTLYFFIRYCVQRSKMGVGL